MNEKYEPKHRRCTKPRHHHWNYGRVTLTGWTVLRCTHCGEVTIG